MVRKKRYLEVADRIIRLIEERELKIGDQIPTEASMVAAYGVSRSTVREAVKHLSAEGILSVQQGRGTFVSNTIEIGRDVLGVAELNVEERLSQLLEARLLLEPQIVICAVQKATEKDIRLLEENIVEMDVLNAVSPAAVKKDVQFHTLIAECTRNEVFVKLIPLICTTVVQTEELITDVGRAGKLAREAHRRIVEAIKARDTLNARYYMEQHIQETIQAMKK